MVLSLNAQYVDLGLPSGTRWSSVNESGLFNQMAAESKFGSSLPTKEQFEELLSCCQWTDGGERCKVIGPNGNCIYFPVNGMRDCNGRADNVGYCGYFWSSTEDGSGGGWFMFCNADGTVGMYRSLYCYKLSVRLVQNY